MNDCVLSREQRLPAAPAEVFPFFGDALDLERLTPAWLGFRVITPRPVRDRVDYSLPLRRDLARIFDHRAESVARFIK
jgi:hypothetical protein